MNDDGRIKKSPKSLVGTENFSIFANEIYQYNKNLWQKVIIKAFTSIA